MATIVRTSLGLANDVTPTELTGSDDFVGATGILYIHNTTGSSQTIVIDGDGSTTVECDGVGDVDVSGGYSVSVAAGNLAQIPLQDIRAYLSGNIAVTGGVTDVFAWIIGLNAS